MKTLRSLTTGLLVIGLMACVLPVMAASDGDVSVALSENLYCSVGDLMEGNIGLLIGLLLMFASLWAMINGAKIAATLPFLIVGSMVTALPSLIESSMKGLGTLLKETNISSANYEPPECGAGGPTLPSKEEMKERMTNRQTGAFYPSRGNYTIKGDCQPGDMRMDCK